MNEPLDNPNQPLDKPQRDRVRERTHRQIREMMENAIKFVALAVILLWARDHTRNLVARAILEVGAGLCFFPGATLRMLCVLAYPDVMAQLIKEYPFLGRKTIHKGEVYRLCVVLGFLGMFGLFSILRSVSFQ